MSAPVDPSLYYDAKSSGMVIEDIKLTMKGSLMAFNVANSGTGMKHVTSEYEIYAIAECYYKKEVRLFDTDEALYLGLCKASTPWEVASPAVALFPDQFQPWEADDQVFVECHKDVYTLTHIGELAFENYLKEEEKLIERIKEQL